MSAFVLLVALFATLVTTGTHVPGADAMDGSVLAITEIVAANDSFTDSFGDTPDWIEIRNTSGSSLNLSGWTLSDDASQWSFPPVSLPAGERRVVFASGRDLDGSEWHSSFSLKRTGETVSLADPDGLLADSISYPELADDMAYGRGSAGGIGVLLAATPGAANTELAPAGVTITTPPQTFEGSINVSMTADVQAGEQIRYTTDSTAVSASSPTYTGPLTLSTSTVVRAAVVGNGAVGPESNAGYIAVSASIATFTSDIPLVIVHSTGAVGEDTQDAIVSVIDRGANGRAGIFDEADYMGFAGLRIRGASSSNFPKKQYKFELWGDRFGDEVPADLLGLGFDSDWVLYAPGRHDRAMINNPFMYELGKRIGVVAPDHQFVELYIEDNPTATVGDGDYLGLFVLRETIEIDEDRVDITEHTPTSAGADGGFIVRYDWNDTCCSNIGTTRFGSRVAVDAPGAVDITSGQLNYIDNWWSGLQSAADSSFAQVDDYIDFDSFIDHWLLEILAFDVDVLRASHFMHLDAGGQLQGGPLWDYDRSMGAADSRVDDLSDARLWGHIGNSGHSYQSDLYEELWAMPEVQARLRARWAELRTSALADAELTSLVNMMGSEIAEAYVREDARWGSTTGYGSRYGGTLAGELGHMSDWLLARTDWLDDQFLSAAQPPQFDLPDTQPFQENTAFSYQVDVTPQSGQVFVYVATGLPEGLAIDGATGLISGTVAYGDAADTFTVSVTVTNSSGASASDTMTMAASAPATRQNPVMLNEFNAVAPGRFLDLGGSDTSFGTTSGNGGDWFELVTMQDQLDMRGWRFETWSNNDNGVVAQTSNLILGQDDLLSSVRAGTIVTVAESVADDLSYDPGAGDWTINLQANNAAQGALWSNQTNFDTNNTRWRLVIRDQFGAVVANVLGETTPSFDDPAKRVNDAEVWAVYTDPTPVRGDIDYGPTVASTFGAPNLATLGGVAQDFSALRPQITMMGDVNCSDSASVADALYLAQYSAGNRTDIGRCPLDDPGTQINASVGDVSGNGRISIQDALIVAQCAVGNPNDFCPE